MRTPKDFQYLSEEIFRQLHQTLSPSTLKRLWGYFPPVHQPHPFTLDLLHRFAEDSKREIITKGQIFGSMAEYLFLLGIQDEQDITNYWSRPLPGYTGIIVWAPEYHHPEWHNEGDAAQLMPTITEWWTPTDESDALADIRNYDNYLRAASFRELRITFMKGLNGQGYTFLGIYSLASASSPRRLLWQCVADRLDLRHLDRLERFR